MKVGIHTFRKFLVLALSALLLMCAAGLWVGCAEEKTEGGYTVTFMTDGGTVYQPVQTQSVEQAVELPVPEKFGYRAIKPFALMRRFALPPSSRQCPYR